ncbi:DUF4871 domain-containing protein [Paenibacillus methanolicus]|uniref:Uncharacterized protein DUF4871 n=1 Tax=Paenibacillus methanolicus TaxID=582686 RepID=A0A5S5BYS9_9BACL|nr:DUF4871 domain-containing protein [Paenibacillus methanolicus]TYP71230.1 uncharacterized protein DUF4871 [Paenibacillus methanolicus]
MRDDKPQWAKAMEKPPFANGRFTEAMKREVMSRAGGGGKRSRARIVRTWVAAGLLVPAAAALLLVIGPFWSGEGGAGQRGGIGAGNSSASVAAAGEAYDEQGRLLFTLSPDPNARAGETAGYLFSFTAPLETFMRRTLTIKAQHVATGEEETLSSASISRPSSGYEGLERYAVRFALPLGGEWRIRVLLDDRLYGQLMLNMPDSSWTPSPLFASGAYEMRGVDRRVGILDVPFTAGQAQKAMWHFWGSRDELNGSFTVKAVKEGSDELITVFKTNPILSSNALAGAINGADRHIPTMIELPEAGKWRLLPYVRGRLLDSVVVEAK